MLDTSSGGVETDGALELAGKLVILAYIFNVPVFVSFRCVGQCSIFLWVHCSVQVKQESSCLVEIPSGDI